MTTFAPDVLTSGPTLLVPEVLLLPIGPVRGHAVVVDDGRFTAVGPSGQLVQQHPDLVPHHLDDHLLMPGFIDCHHHLTQSFGSALAFGEPSEIFRRVWVPLEQSLDDESAYVATKLAALRSLRGGFTTVADAGTRATVDADVIADAIRATGLRTVLGLTCNDADLPAAATRSILGRAERHLARFAGDPLVHPSLAVSVPEAATESTLRTVADMCREHDSMLQIHVNEHLAGVERSLLATGERPLEHLHRIGVTGPHLLGAHATLLTAAEVKLIAETGTAISYNPVASSWKGNAVAPALAMIASDVRFGLGTDGTRSDAFRLVDAAETAQRLTAGMATGDSSCGGGRVWLDHGTRLAADAVGLGDVVGDIAVGKAADFLLVDLGVPETTPSWDLSWELVRLAGKDQLTAVVVAGRVALWRGWPLDWDAREFLHEAAKIAEAVVDSAPIVRVHPTADELGRRADRMDHA